MRILFIHNHYKYFGGEDTYLFSLKKLLEQHKHKVYLYTKHNKNLISTRDKIKTAADLLYNRECVNDIEKVIRRFNPQIAHFHNLYPQIGDTAYWICNKFNIPIVQRVPSFRHLCPKATLYRNNKLCMLCVNKRFKYHAIQFKCYANSYFASAAFVTAQFFHRIINSYQLVDMYQFQSNFIKDLYIKQTGIPKKKTVVIPHFVFKQKNNSNSKREYFIYIGRLSEEKGIMQLLQIFSKMPTVNLKIIGDGPLLNQVISYCRFCNIKYLGFLLKNESAPYISKAKAVIIPSMWYETGPFVLMESFAYATPVIAPNFGVFTTQVKHNKNGFLYEKDNMLDLAKKVRIINNNKILLKSMSKNAYQTYLQNYTPQIHYKKIVSLYRKISHE